MKMQDAGMVLEEQANKVAEAIRLAGERESYKKRESEGVEHQGCRKQKLTRKKIGRI